MASCSCGNNYKPNYSGKEDDKYCYKCRDTINRVLNFTDKTYEHENVTSKITEIGGE